MRTITLALALVPPLLYSVNAMATSCSAQQVYWASVNARGEVQAGGTFGVAKSIDGGQHWTALAAVRPARASATDQAASIIQPDTVTRDENGREYACSADRERVAWRDAGRDSWHLGEPLDRRGQSASIDLRSKGKSRSTLHISDLNGKIVETRTGDTPMVLTNARSDTCASIIVRQDTVYVLGGDALFASRDAGKTWFGVLAPTAARYQGAVKRRLFVDDAGTVYVNGDTPTAMRIFASPDGGLHWNVLPLTGLHKTDRRDEILYASAGADLYALTGVTGYSYPQLMQAYRMRKDGKSAVAILTLPDDANGMHLASLDATNHGDLALAANGGLESRVFVSKDRGSTWTTTQGERLTSQPWMRCNGPPPR